jgi:hypothetical protein
LISGLGAQCNRQADGIELTGKRADEPTVRSARSYGQRRLVENVSLPGSETALRRLFQELRGDADPVSLPMARAIRRRLSAVYTELASLGEVESIEYTGVGELGEDVYAVRFAGGNEQWRIGLAADGTIGYRQTTSCGHLRWNYRIDERDSRVIHRSANLAKPGRQIRQHRALIAARVSPNRQRCHGGKHR